MKYQFLLLQRISQKSHVCFNYLQFFILVVSSKLHHPAPTENEHQCPAQPPPLHRCLQTSPKPQLWKSTDTSRSEITHIKNPTGICWGKPFWIALTLLCHHQQNTWAVGTEYMWQTYINTTQRAALKPIAVSAITEYVIFPPLSREGFFSPPSPM